QKPPPATGDGAFFACSVDAERGRGPVPPSLRGDREPVVCVSRRVRLRDEIEVHADGVVVHAQDECVRVGGAPGTERDVPVVDGVGCQMRHRRRPLTTIGAMAATVERSEALLLTEYGLKPKGRIHRNPTTAMLYTHALANKDGVLAEGGPLAVDTGSHTGRSPKDKFIVRERGSEDRIWWGDVNRPIDEENFFGLRDKVVAYLNVRPVLYVVDAFAGADLRHR